MNLIKFVFVQVAVIFMVQTLSSKKCENEPLSNLPFAIYQLSCLEKHKAFSLSALLGKDTFLLLMIRNYLMIYMHPIYAYVPFCIFVFKASYFSCWHFMLNLCFCLLVAVLFQNQKNLALLGHKPRHTNDVFDFSSKA